MTDKQTDFAVTKASTVPNDQWVLLAMAAAVAVVSTLSALFIGEIMGQMPCLLCWYQRIFMFPLAIILIIALYRSDSGIWLYALPLALGGLGFALYHSGLYGGLIPKPIVPCSKSGPSCTDANMTIFSLPLPYLSALAFLAIVAGLGLLAIKSRKGTLS